VVEAGTGSSFIVGEPARYRLRVPSSQGDRSFSRGDMGSFDRSVLFDAADFFFNLIQIVSMHCQNPNDKRDYSIGCSNNELTFSNGAL
jgi:hypothetical protein